LHLFIDYFELFENYLAISRLSDYDMVNPSEPCRPSRLYKLSRLKSGKYNPFTQKFNMKGGEHISSQSEYDMVNLQLIVTHETLKAFPRKNGRFNPYILNFNMERR